MADLKLLNKLRNRGFYFFCVIVFYFFPMKLLAPKENNQWMIGWEFPTDHSFLDFNSGGPISNYQSSSLGFFLTNASICDISGQLLFYTRCNKISQWQNTNKCDFYFNFLQIFKSWAIPFI